MDYVTLLKYWGKKCAENGIKTAVLEGLGLKFMTR